jgi:HAE1 family hydrophobic/amphiphilic exporter-1
MVVDNAIVVLENFFRHRAMGKDAVAAAIDGGREVWGGVLASTLTTMAVFLPILGIEEEAGQLFADLAITIASAVGLSLLVALLVVPPLCALLWRERKEHAHHDAAAGAAEALAAGRAAGVGASAPAAAAPPAGRPVAEREGLLTRAYGAVVSFLVSPRSGAALHRVALVLLITAASALSLRYIPAPGYLPAGNSNFIFFLAQPIPGLRIEQVADNLETLERWVLRQEETRDSFSVASSAFNGGGVMLKPEYGNGPALDAFVGKMFGACAEVPGFRFLLPMRLSLFNDPGSQFEVHVSGPDLTTLARTADELVAKLGALKGVQSARSGYVEGRPELKVDVDARKAAEQGLSVAEVAAVVETALAGRRVSLFSDGGRDHDVTLVVPPERVQDEEALRQLPLVTPHGEVVVLADLATIEQRSGPVSIDRRERQRNVTLTVSLEPGVPLGAAIERAELEVLAAARTTLPAGCAIELGGSADKLTQTLAALTDSFWLAILITYLLLVALFRGWLEPLVILVTVPLALSGGVAAIAFAQGRAANASFDVLTMIGFILLAGIVVNNAILIVHQANNFRSEGMERRRALSESARTRLRPIAMTVITTVAGLLPLAIGGGAGSELYQGLGIVLLGGLVASTLFTLFLVPALLALGWDVADALRPRARA